MKARISDDLRKQFLTKNKESIIAQLDELKTSIHKVEPYSVSSELENNFAGLYGKLVDIKSTLDKIKGNVITEITRKEAH